MTIVPVMEEVLVVEKRLMVREELRLTDPADADARAADGRRCGRRSAHVERVPAPTARPVRIRLRRIAGQSGSTFASRFFEPVWRAAGAASRVGPVHALEQIMSHAIIGMFDTAAAATKAQQQLIAAGIPASAIKMTGTGAVSASSGTTTQSTAVGSGYEDKGFWASVKEMFGADEESDADRHISTYTEGARRGGSILSVDATEAQADKVADILNAAGAVDVDEKVSQWEKTGYVAPKAAVATAATTTTARAASTGTMPPPARSTW